MTPALPQLSKRLSANRSPRRIMVLQQMYEVLCPWCVRQGGLKIVTGFQARPVESPIKGRMRFVATEVPILACELCDASVAGDWDGPGRVVFPDPHVQT